MRRVAAAVVVALFSIGASPVQRGAAAVRVPVVVELFTSEGCSSCPPADALLTDLVRTQPVAGADVIGLSEHVDYWNNLGWRDPFSNAIFTTRQTAYVQALNLDNAYTPQMIVDGTTDVLGSDREAVESAIRHAAARPKAALRVGWTDDRHGAMTIALGANPVTARAAIWIGVVEDGLVSRVTRGENEGHTLSHSAVTRRLVRAGQADESGRFSSVTPIALDASWTRAHSRVVVFAEDPRSRIVAAATLPIAR